MAAGLSLATAALASEAHAANSPKLLPSGGLRKTLHSGKLHIKAVVYGSSGEIKDDAFKVKPPTGMHYTTVKVGLKNLGPTAYARDLTAALAVTNDHGAVSKAVALGKHGLGKVVLKKDTTAYGRVFFAVRDNTRIHTVRFRAFAAAPTVSVFAVRGSGTKQTADSTKPLPAGGTRKIVRKGSSVLRAVLYGVGGGVEGRAIGAKSHAGSHFIAVKVGLANLGSKPYAGNLALLSSVTNTKGKISQAVPSAGMGKISLAPSHTVKGRVFFEIKDKTRLSKFRLRPFGSTGKLAIFVVRKG
jgi:hypothetical protein